MVEARSITVHGVTATVSFSEPELLGWFEFDFRYFLLSTPLAKADISIAVELIAPPRNAIPPLDAIMQSRWFACFEKDSKRYIDYQGTTLVVFDYKEESGRVYSEDAGSAYDKLYLTLLSRIGEKLDRRGIHRVHSLGISFNEKACLFLITEGGGKSTLALPLLDDKRVKLFSEDTPLIDNDGQVLPFPVRLGIVNGENTAKIPSQFKREFVSKLGTEKVLVDVAYYKDRIASRKTPISFLFCGKWTTADRPRIEKATKVGAASCLIRDCVFGLGLPQVIELFLTSGLKGFSAKFFIAISRLFASLALLVHSECYQLYLCRDREKNAELVLSFLQNHC